MLLRGLILIKSQLPIHNKGTHNISMFTYSKCLQTYSSPYVYLEKDKIHYVTHTKGH